jgi:hypothetical protein
MTVLCLIRRGESRRFSDTMGKWIVAHDEDGDDVEEVARGKSSGIQRRVKKEQPGGEETTFHGHTFHCHKFHGQKFHGLRIFCIKPRESQSKPPWPVLVALNRKVLHFPWPQLTGMFNGPQGPALASL